MTIEYSPPVDDGLNICFRDDDLLVLNKPSGLLSVPGRGKEKQDCLISRVQREYPTALVVHRLDMSTSGLIVMALNKQVQASMGRLFEQRQIRKHYLAVVSGQLINLEGVVNLPLMTDWPNRPRQKVDHDSGKPSLTKYSVLNYDVTLNQSYVQLRPLTGRSHQLRAHMMALGHPILGDELYAPEPVRAASNRLLLHATELFFVHPVRGQMMEISCPADFFDRDTHNKRHQ